MLEFVLQQWSNAFFVRSFGCALFCNGSPRQSAMHALFPEKVSKEEATSDSVKQTRNPESEHLIAPSKLNSDDWNPPPDKTCRGDIILHRFRGFLQFVNTDRLMKMSIFLKHL